MPAVLTGTTDLRFEPRRGEGPVGTGVHLLRRTHDSTGVTIADVWLTFLFLPVVPFGEWTVERGGASGPSWRVTRIERPRVMRSLAWLAGGMVAGLLSLVPAYVAVAFFMGSKPAELAGLFSSAGGIIGTVGWLDQTRERVPFRTAVRALVGAARSPDHGAEE